MKFWKISVGAALAITAATWCGAPSLAADQAGTPLVTQLATPAPPRPPGWTVELSPLYSEDAGADTRGTPSDSNNGRMRMDYYVSHAFGKRFSASFRQINLDFTPGRFLTPTKTIYPNPDTDVISTAYLSYAMSQTFSADAGWYRRWRTCCGGAGDPANAEPAYFEGPYVQLNARFGPTSKSGKMFTAYIQGQDAHRTMDAVALAALPVGERSEVTPNSKMLMRAGIQAQYTIPGTDVTPFILWNDFVTYFSNLNAFPNYGNWVTYGIRRSLGRHATFELSHNEYVNHLDGSGPAPGNVIHYSYFTLRTTYRFAGL